VQQFVAEQQIILRSRRGFAVRTEWRQLRPRNEALDCRVYARAAVWLAGADRWSNLKWRDLEIQLGLEEPATARVEAPIVAVQRPMVTEQPIAAQQAVEPADLGGAACATDHVRPPSMPGSGHVVPLARSAPHSSCQGVGSAFDFCAASLRIAVASTAGKNPCRHR
jgi:phage terminase large subunit GpA